MSRSSWLLAAVACQASLAWVSPCSGQGSPACFAEEARLGATDAEADDNFGWAVAVSGDTAVVGAPYEDEVDAAAGAAYVFVKSGGAWVQQAKLTASDGEGLDQFGSALAVSGDTIAVGAFADDDAGTTGGSVYVFVRVAGVWSQQAKLLSSAPSSADRFGFALDLDGDTLVVSAEDDDFGYNSGAAYVFVRQGTSWSEQARLLASDGDFNDRFGYAVAVDGDTVLVGAVYEDESADSAGATYVFVRAGGVWTEQAKLLAGDGAQEDYFGCSVALDLDTALIGATDDDDLGSTSGSVYVFVREGTSWTQQAKLLASDGAPEDRFGWAVAVQGDEALASASWPYSSGGGGAVHAFLREGTRWTPVGALVASGAAAAHGFGTSLAASGSTVLVGADRHDEGGTDTGSAFVFELPGAPGAVYCTCPAGPCGNPDPEAGCANSTGVGAQLVAYGARTPDAVHLFVHGARPSKFALFLQTDGAAMAPFGDGFRCADGGVVPLTRAPVATAPDGSAVYGPCFGDDPISTATGVVPGSGDTKRYQFWYRDPEGPCSSNFNLSNGYEITW